MTLDAVSVRSSWTIDADGSVRPEGTAPRRRPGRAWKPVAVRRLAPIDKLDESKLELARRIEARRKARAR